MTDIPSQNPVQPPTAPLFYAEPPKKKRGAAVWILAILLALSVLCNLALLGGLVLVGMGISSSMSSDLSIDGSNVKGLKETITQSGDANQRIAVIQVHGIITGGSESAFGTPTSTSDYAFLKLQVERAINDSRVKIVVLNVDSPGGEASAADMMLHELKKLKSPKVNKKIIVHMGSLAASGGYYISMAGDKIIADPSCLTGSIGVIAEFFSVQGLLNDKLGVAVNTIKSGAMKDVGSPFRNMTPEEVTYLHDTLIMPIFERFKDFVKEGRPKMSADEVDALADGRVFTAEAAKKNGLIDQIGYLQDALDAAAQDAHLTRPTVVQYGRQVTFLDALGLSSQARTGGAATLLNLSRQTLDELGTPKVEMLWKIE